MTLEPESNPLLGLQEAALSIWNQTPELQARFGSAASIGFWNWLMVEGVLEHPVILEHLPAAPHPGQLAGPL